MKTPRTITEMELREMLLRIVDGHPSQKLREDFEGRELVVTDFNGTYGQAGTAIVLEGSPPRGVIVSLETESHRRVPPAIFYLAMDGSRRIGEAQARLVRRFLEQRKYPRPPLKAATEGPHADAEA